MGPLRQIVQHSKKELSKWSLFSVLLETPVELKINLSCTVSCSALNCTVVQWWTLHDSSVLYCTTLYYTIQFCNTLYCIVMYWSLMQSMVLSVLLQKGVAVAMCIGCLVCHWLGMSESVITCLSVCLFVYLYVESQSLQSGVVLQKKYSEIIANRMPE